MIITKASLYSGAILSSSIACLALLKAKNDTLKLFSFYVLLCVILDFCIGYFVVDFGQVDGNSFHGWIIMTFYLPWILLHSTAAIFVGIDEIVETYGVFISTIAYYSSLYFWAFVLFTIQITVKKVFLKTIK